MCGPHNTVPSDAVQDSQSNSNERNNFPYRNFFKIEVDFNENLEKLLGLNLTRICWNFFSGLQILMKLGPRASVCT
jgi:hypothetical protein